MKFKIAQSTSAAIAILTMALIEPALAQNQLTEATQLQSGLQRQLTAMYAESLGQLITSDEISEDNKIPMIQNHIGRAARCATQRLWLSQNLTDAADKARFGEERITLLEHYKYFSFALQRHDLSTYEKLSTQLRDDTSILLDQIDGIYQRNKANDSNQATAELLTFADACNAFLKEAQAMERRAAKVLANQ